MQIQERIDKSREERSLLGKCLINGFFFGTGLAAGTLIGASGNNEQYNHVEPAFYGSIVFVLDKLFLKNRSQYIKEDASFCIGVFAGDYIGQSLRMLSQ